MALASAGAISLMIELLGVILIFGFGTIAVLGWLAGNVVINTFLTLITVALFATLLSAGAANSGPATGCVIAIAIIWAPAFFRRRLH